MKIEHSDSHTVEFLDEAALAFMTLTVHRLNESLKRHGVEDAAQRQEICSSFLFEFAYQHDAGWLVHADRRMFPLVCFAVREKPSPEENLGTISELHVPTAASSWHEYAAGVVSGYFEQDAEAAPAVVCGSYDSADD